MTTANRDIIIKDTHRGLLYEDGRLAKILEAGRYELPAERVTWTGKRKGPRVEVVLVDVRQRDLTIKGQEILTRDKVAIRVSIVVQFRVTDPRAALHEVENFEDRIYTDVQLGARRSLASQSLEEILTNRNRLSEDILADVQSSAAEYGVIVLRADVKDLIFPGNLQEIMNRVLAAERNGQAQLLDAQTKAEVAKLEAATRAEARRLDAEAGATAARVAAEADAQALRIKSAAEADLLEARKAAAVVMAANPVLLRQLELEALRDVAKAPNARIFVDLSGHGRQSFDAEATGTAATV